MADSDHDVSPDDDEPASKPRSKAPRWIAAGCVAALLVWQRHTILDTARASLGMPVPYRPAHEANLGAIDLAQVHGPLWTTWVVAAASDDAEARSAAEAAMRAAIADDPNLSALFDELATIVNGLELGTRRRAQRARWLTGAWNQYLDANAMPYFIDAQVRLGPRPMYVAVSYAVTADGTATVGGEPHRVRALDRLDTLNVRETYSGYVSTASDGALIIADRAMQFAIDRLWPALATTTTTTVSGTPARLRATFGAAISAEAERALSPAAFAALRETAQARAEAVAAFEAVEARRHCSDFILRPVPWHGHEPDALDRLERWVSDDECPGITVDELAALRRVTEVARARTDLWPALAELARWRSRGVATHELRHAADDVDAEDDDDLPCEICPASSHVRVRAELSAYLAEFAWSEAPAVALFDACFVAEEAQTEHGQAVAIALREGSWRCDRVPEEITATARGLELEAFGRSEAIEIGDVFRDAFAPEVVESSDP